MKSFKKIEWEAKCKHALWSNKYTQVREETRSWNDDDNDVDGDYKMINNVNWELNCLAFDNSRFPD